MIRKSDKIKYNSGTTLVELMVVIFIFVVITGITIFNYGQFNSSISIQNLADDIALTVRRAQGYAIGVRGSANMFSVGYGVHFKSNPLVPGQAYKGSNKSFILFADLGPSPNLKYDNSGYTVCGSPFPLNECMEILNILSNDQIDSIFYKEEGNLMTVPPEGSVSVVFRRPNPEPTFCYRPLDSYTSCDKSLTITSVNIQVSNTTNGETKTKTVSIANNGLISVSSN